MTDQILKIVVVGDCGVGKTSLCRAIQKQKFSGVYIPTIADSFLTHWIYTRKTINLHIHDQSGDRKYKMICDSYYRSSNQFLVVFDLSDRKSFESVDYWVENIRKYASDNINIYLVGTKGDLSTRQVTEEQMKSCASRLRLDVNIEVNSNTESGINELIDQISIHEEMSSGNVYTHYRCKCSNHCHGHSKEPTLWEKFRSYFRR